MSLWDEHSIIVFPFLPSDNGYCPWLRKPGVYGALIVYEYLFAGGGIKVLATYSNPTAAQPS